MVSVIGVGDNTVDRYLHLGTMFPGGNAVNVAVLARRHGAKASYIGWFGNDEAGRLLQTALRQEGVDISRCRVVDGPNAQSSVTLVNGDRVFGPSSPGVTNQICLEEADLDFIRQHDLTHTSIYSYIEPQLAQLRKAAPKLSFDFSNHWKLDYVREVAPYVDIAFLSTSDYSRADTVALMRWIASLGPSLVVATRGSEGSLAFDGERIYEQGIVPTQVVDTLGAGDSFAARLIVELLSGSTLEHAMAMAAVSAAQTCTYYGAFGYGHPITPPGS